jgi:hypothetical protein
MFEAIPLHQHVMKVKENLCTHSQHRVGLSGRANSLSYNHQNPLKIDVLGAAFITQFSQYFPTMFDAPEQMMDIFCA